MIWRRLDTAPTDDLRGSYARTAHRAPSLMAAAATVGAVRQR